MCKYSFPVFLICFEKCFIISNSHCSTSTNTRYVQTNVFCLFHRVCGFDHAELDVQQLHWHRHMYPYKLAAYQYTALSEAVTLGVIDCSAAAQGTAVESDLMAGNVAVTTLVMKHGGSGDGVAVWVDYELTPGNFLRSFENERFAHHVTVNIKFFPTPCQLQAGDAVRAEVVLDGKKMDFDYDFAMA